MRLLLLGDFHYRASHPINRKDDYVAAQERKAVEVETIARDRKCDYILQPGDFFDKATPPYWLVSRVITRHRNSRWLVVLGQHDQRYHTAKRGNTPVGVLEAAGVVRVLGKLPYLDAGVAFYGSSWGEKIPTPKVDPVREVPRINNPRMTRVLVMHRMVINTHKLWEDQTEFSWSQNLLKRYPYDLIVTGDNHQFFVDSYEDKFKHKGYLVNCGSLMRSNIDQADHHPSVVVYDTSDWSIEVIKLTSVAPAEEVFRAGESEGDKQHSKDLEAFIEQVSKGQGAPDLDFLDNVRKLAAAEKVDELVTAKLDEIITMSTGELK